MEVQHDLFSLGVHCEQASNLSAANTYIGSCAPQYIVVWGCLASNPFSTVWVCDMDNNCIASSAECFVLCCAASIRNECKSEMKCKPEMNVNQK